MPELLSQAIEQAVELFDRKVGEGDLTTESVWPYARHAEAEIKAKEAVSWVATPILEAMVKHADPTIETRTESDIEASFSSGDTVVRLEGNGQAILTSWRVANPLISVLSAIQAEVRKAVDELRPAKIDVVHNHDLVIGHDKLIRYAVEEGGGVSLGTGLDEIVYLSPDHITWVGSLQEAMKRIIEEVGDTRSLIKVIVEVSKADNVVELPDLKPDFVYCRNFTTNEIKRVGELTKGWTRLIIDETVSLQEAKGLRDAGVRMYMVNANSLLKSDELFSIQFND